MFKTKAYTYDKQTINARPKPGYRDIFALIIVFSILCLIGIGSKDMVTHFQVGQALPISLSPWALPYYALRTILRMFIALGFSLLFTFIFATWAAKNKHAERIIIPAIDILQSVPVLGYLSITITGFIALFPGSLLGPECAAIFAIFSAQVWNMTLSFYQSLRTVPRDLHEAANMFQLSAWQRFWKIEVPFAMPGLIWNMMMSMSGSWVFLVASEAISVANHHITLPGIGSYIELATAQQNWVAVGDVIIAVLLVIFLYDQIIFRPLVAWAEKFKKEHNVSEEAPESWLLDLFQKAKLVQYMLRHIHTFVSFWVNNPWCRKRQGGTKKKVSHASMLSTLLFYGLLSLALITATIISIQFIGKEVSLDEVRHVCFLGLATGIKVMILILISSIIWVPIGVKIGLNPKASRFIQPIIQFLAAFPVNLLFGVFAYIILTYKLNITIWTSPLMMLGTQWYILFNIIAGTMAIPENLKHATATINIRGWLWWKRFILPAIFPYYITGAITAAGGAWNISIISEAITWGNHNLYATGLGAYITQVTTKGDFPRIILGIIIMSLYVVIINRLIWRPLYQMAENKYLIDS